MKSVMTRCVSFALMLALLLTCGVQMAFPAKAAYENTYVNTGDQRADLIGVALTQVGYREGSGGWTKYGNWYGSSYMAWCGAFVSWCANQAGIPTSVLRKNGFASARDFGIPSFTVYDRIPRPGDLFFKNNGGHTGIVYYVEGNYFYTLEGNTYEAPTYEDGVYIRKRNLYGEYYFGSPNYQSDTNHNYQKGWESEHPHKEYYQCADCGSKYYTGKNVTVDGCKECLMANCTHNYGNYTKVDGTYHKAVCSICTKETSTKHQWKDSRVVKEATCKEAGSKQQTCALCAAVREVEIPKTEDHQYDKWEYVDGEKHVGICSTCGHEEEAAHSVEDWESGSRDHWYTCADCEGRVQLGNHTFANGCESACTGCGYVNPDGHNYATVLSTDENSHWYACLNCGSKKDLQEHIYGAECAEECAVCGHTRQTEHTYAAQWSSDASGHWHACEKCGKAEEMIAHVPGSSATEDAAQICVVCSYEIAPVKAHQHVYEPFAWDADNHWGTCECGYEMEPQPHTWDMASGVCSTCGTTPVVPEKTEIPWLIILPCVAGVAFLTMMILITVAVKRRKKAKAKELAPAI